MTDGLARVYAVVVSALAFFVAWAVIAAHPWRTSARDPRLVALDERRVALTREAAHVRQMLAHRYAAYRIAYRARQRAIARARAEQTRLDRLAAIARARYLAAAPIRTVTVYANAAPPPQPVTATPAPAPASAPAPAAPPPPPPPTVVSIPAVAATQTS